MGDLILNYRACGAECREDWLRMLAHDNGLPLVAVRRGSRAAGAALTATVYASNQTLLKEVM